MMDRKRELALLNWCRGVLNDNNVKVTPASSDASFRRTSGGETSLHSRK